MPGSNHATSPLQAVTAATLLFSAQSEANINLEPAALYPTALVLFRTIVRSQLIALFSSCLILPRWLLMKVMISLV